MVSEIPYLAIGNDELGSRVGKTALCPHCNKRRKVRYGRSRRILPDGRFGEWKESGMLGFVNCGKESYIVAINGKIIL